MSKRLLGVARKAIAIERGVMSSEPGSPPAYIVSCRMPFESIDAFLAAWTLHGDCRRRVPTTDAQPVIQSSEPLPFA